eukprot:4229041-Amphidinium_carterae.1
MPLEAEGDDYSCSQTLGSWIAVPMLASWIQIRTTRQQPITKRMCALGWSSLKLPFPAICQDKMQLNADISSPLRSRIPQNSPAATSGMHMGQNELHEVVVAYSSICYLMSFCRPPNIEVQVMYGMTHLMKSGMGFGSLLGYDAFHRAWQKMAQSQQCAARTCV